MSGWEADKQIHSTYRSGKPNSPGYTQDQAAEVARYQAELLRLSTVVSMHSYWSTLDNGAVGREWRSSTSTKLPGTRRRARVRPDLDEHRALAEWLEYSLRQTRRRIPLEIQEQQEQRRREQARPSNPEKSSRSCRWGGTASAGYRPAPGAASQGALPIEAGASTAALPAHVPRSTDPAGRRGGHKRGIR